MTLLDRAHSFDRERRILEAVETYERAIEDVNAPLWAILNLEGIYWDACSGPGCSFPEVATDTFINHADKRLYELMQLAKSRFPDSTAAEFWCRYILMRTLGDDFSQEACQRLYDRDPSEHIPLMYLYALPGGRKWEPEALQLISRYEAEGTVLAGYVVSFLKSVVTHYQREDRQQATARKPKQSG